MGGIPVECLGQTTLGNRELSIQQRSLSILQPGTAVNASDRVDYGFIGLTHHEFAFAGDGRALDFSLIR
jgi:hypothetical protein